MQCHAAGRTLVTGDKPRTYSASAGQVGYEVEVLPFNPQRKHGEGFTHNTHRHVGCAEQYAPFSTFSEQRAISLRAHELSGGILLYYYSMQPEPCLRIGLSISIASTNWLKQCDYFFFFAFLSMDRLRAFLFSPLSPPHYGLCLLRGTIVNRTK